MSVSLFLPPIIGLTGRAGCGKDTAAWQLSSMFGYVRYSCADPIKDYLDEWFGWERSYWDDREWKENATFAGHTPRAWAQWLGTEVGRTLAGEDVWIEALLTKAASDGNHARTAIADIRFNNEARLVQSRGGIVIDIDRPGLPPVRDHASERGVDDLWIDYYVKNDGTVAELAAKLRVIVQGWSKDFGHARA